MSEHNGHDIGVGVVPSREDRKIVCLGMPSYGQCTDRAATGLYRPTNNPQHDVRIWGYSSSLATGNMNGLWCWMLNTARKGRCDYFAMQHTDIEPEEFWLDKLIEEMEAKDLDVLGAIAPIKDARGVSSCAMTRPDGCTWRIKARITMHEAWNCLPETFTSADMPEGSKLLINTGLWVCRVGPDWKDWAPKVFFTVNDRIMIDPASGDYYHQTEPEDWFVSRIFHELGRKVGCTRKVRLEHRGTMAFTNEIPWGKNEFDKEYVDRSPFDGRPKPDWFPHDVAGWLTEEEGAELARLAEGKSVIEVGSYCGKSTICLAKTATLVAAIDTFNGRGTALQGNTRPLFEKNIRRHGVANKVAVYQGESVSILGALPPVHDLAFIDGSHDKESVLKDALAASLTLKPGGILAFHDYGGVDVGVTEAVTELVAGGAELLSRCGSLAIVRPCAAELVGG